MNVEHWLIYFKLNIQFLLHNNLMSYEFIYKLTKSILIKLRFILTSLYLNLAYLKVESKLKIEFYSFANERL